VTDDDDPERVWKVEEVALADLKQEGWAVSMAYTPTARAVRS
jgi:hypothetical protein